MRIPQRGEIWLVQFPADPVEKGWRPVVVISLNARNRHAQANTVLVVPLSTSAHRGNVPTHVLLSAEETGLQADSIVRAEDITIVRKTSLMEPHGRLRPLSDTRVGEIAAKVMTAMGCL